MKISSTPKILIVDDTPANLVALKLLLKKVQANVIKANSGAEALQLTLEHDFALILLDAHMPEMDGYETAEILSSTPGTNTIPIIFVTAAYKDEVHRLNSYKAGAVDYIQKPIEDHILISKVTVFLELFNQRIELEALQSNLELLIEERTEELLRTNKIASIGGWKLSPDLNHISLSEQASEILNLKEYSPEDEIPIEEFINKVYEEDRESVRDAFIRDLKKPVNDISFEFRFMGSDGTLRTANSIINYIKVKGNEFSFVGALQDITERKEAERAVQYMAQYDALTQLPNRYLFNDRLDIAFATATRLQTKVSLMLIDLDYFKEVNDTLGHPIGDLLLKEVAKRLLDCIRDTDSVARLGGDEFAIIAVETHATLAINTLAARCLAALAKPFELDGHIVNISGSIGIALFPSDGNDQEEVMKCADLALYESKEKGRNNFHFYNRKMDETIHLKMQEEAQIATAIKEKKLELYYQPQIDLKTKKVIGAEALVCWNHPEKGMVLPDDFIPLAKDTGLIIPMMELVFEVAIKQIDAWRKAGLCNVNVAVNLSLKQIAHGDFITMVENVISELTSDESMREGEIIATNATEEKYSKVYIFKLLKSEGVSLVIDNFDTSFSSIASLKKLSTEFLKIDRRLIKYVHKDPVDMKILQSIIDVVHTLKMKVIAQGVETSSQLSFLRENNCDIAQGIIYSHPMTADEFVEWLTQYQAENA